MSDYTLNLHGIKLEVDVCHGHNGTRDEPPEEGYLEQVTIWIGDVGIILSEIPADLEAWIGDETCRIEWEKQ